MNKNGGRKLLKRRIARYKKKVPLTKTVGNSITLKCEYYDTIKYRELGLGYVFTSTSLSTGTFRNIKDIILNSQTYLKFVPLYGKVRINSVKIMVTPVNNLLAVSNNVGSLPLSAFAFYPNFTSTGVDANATIAHDTVLVFDPAHNYFQTRTWKFPKQFFEGPNGTGYGVEFDPGQINSLSGQISVTNITPFIGSPPNTSYVVFNFVCIVSVTLGDQIW